MRDQLYSSVKRVKAVVLLFVVPILLGCAGNTQVSGQNQEEGFKKEVVVPLGGNTYQTNPESNESITTEGIQQWSNVKSIFSTFVKVTGADSVKVSAKATLSSANSTIAITVGGSTKEVELSESDSYVATEAPVFPIEKEGYVQIDIKGVDKTGTNFAKVRDLILHIPEQASVTYIENNEENNFYWGRRGPSVHLQHKLPENTDFEWFYSEITVRKGEDPVGSYFMANGFSEGYFGIQVNSEQERRVLFSVWSPYNTDNPDDIPADERIQLLAKGDGVEAGEFGNEGSGGQSYWVFPWKPGNTYKFLNRVKPDGEGNTINTAYFYAPELGEWKLIVSFLRPKTDKWMTGIYSFLENFAASNGYKKRKGYYGNQWVRDKEGSWHEITGITFTGDKIANSGFRVDFSSGVDGKRFYLRNGGFEVGEVTLQTEFNRDATGTPPDIAFDSLPKGQ
ncbi:DUF3472 domain-containing protein [Fodinibius saliphilus]|uniref:DUF3472 domain-containing protein n=1 Tax=Fodinibius saliphilus TaxID=1920650 RepID=UPI001107F814|nr:DUF3472 domain-containing protein [Fodinibius saliphilus]